ncbi:hypothetical protein BOX15_Mlig008811g2 [Macrostomum lignano]|nr:hypothetical protein BOX15_Mlig008811g2 [Macrostomum lignano]
MSPEMKALRSQLGDWRTEILRHLPFSNGFLDVVISRISEWVCSTQFPVYTWQQFVETVRNKVNPLCSEDHLKDLIQELQYTGEVIYLESDAGHDMIVLSPQWLCSSVLGFLLSQDNISQARVTGSFTADDIQFMIAGTEANQLLRILIALDLCTQVEVEDEVQYEFPCLNFLDSVRGLWEKEPRHDASVYAGMQMRATKSQLVHIFPRLQCSLRRSLKVDKEDEQHSPVLSEADLFQWHHGSKLSLAGVECMLRMEECDQVIRLRARGPRQQLPLLFGIYQDMVNLIEQTIEDTCPSMEYEVSVLSPKELRNHSKVAIAVPQGVIFRAIEDQRNSAPSSSEVMVNFENGLVLESLESLLCFGNRQLLTQLTLGPDLHLSCLRTPSFQRLCSMFDPVDPLGKDWCLLAVRLGMTHSVPNIDSGNEWLRSRTAKILDEWGKEPGGTIGALIGIFKELGRADAADLLMDSAPLYQYSPNKADDAAGGTGTVGASADSAVGAGAGAVELDQATCGGSGSTLSR